MNDTSALPIAPPAADTRKVPCAHCGLPATHRGEAEAFCCTGCEMVHHALRDAGLDATFYRLRNIQETGPGRPSEARLDALFLAELDSRPFLDAHTHLEADGSRSGVFQLEGIHCAGCVWLVEQMPQMVSGVAESRLNLVRGRLRLRWQPDRVPLSDLARWLARFGYRLQSAAQEPAGVPEAERRLLRRVGAAWALAGNVMLLAVAGYAGLDLVSEPQLAASARWVSFALTCVALVYGGQPFFVSAWQSIRTGIRLRHFRNMHMDTPIALGVLLAFLHSAWMTIQGTGEVWFDSISVLIAALLTARWLQFRSLRWAQETANRLLRLIPVMARRVVDGAERELVACTELAAGDTIEVLAGEVVPVDGQVLIGVSAIDNAALTGESRPQTIGPGAPVEAGAINRGADLLVRVDVAGGETRLGRLLDWVERHDADRAPVSYLVDRISAYFVLAVLVLTAVTGWIWWSTDPDQAIFNMVALLVITCPCALAMATPLSLAVATGRAAGRGVFLKHQSVFQTFHDSDTIVFDKTGTLTIGELRVVDIEGDPAALVAAGALERGLTHPIARVLALYAADTDQASSRQSTPGRGIEGVVGGRTIRVGRPDWVLDGEACPEALRTAIRTYTNHGHVTVAVAVDGVPAAVIALADAVRAEARRLIGRLQARGKSIHLLSGDHPNVVRYVADQLGIPADRATGYATPEQKQAYLQQLRQEGHAVAMVGDGINDAAALRAASVGVAVAGTLSPGFSAADVYVSREGLGGVNYLMSASQDVMRRIRVALWFSLAYNLAGAAAAMAGLVHPLLAAVAMPISSLIVATLASAPALAVSDEEV